MHGLDGLQCNFFGAMAISLSRYNTRCDWLIPGPSGDVIRLAAKTRIAARQREPYNKLAITYTC